MAHTLQRSGGLAAVADSTNHVIGVLPTMAEMVRSEGQPSPRRLGVRHASTFPGFCNAHDAVFSPIKAETLIMTDEAA